AHLTRLVFHALCRRPGRSRPGVFRQLRSASWLRCPPYYTAKLMQDFVQAGDTVITAASDYTLLSTYAVRRQDGSLTILTINKSPSNTATGQVAVAGFVPAKGAAVYS